MRRFFLAVVAVLIVAWAVAVTFHWNAGAQDAITPPPDLYSGMTQISASTETQPAVQSAEAVYATEDYLAQVAVGVVSADTPLLAWGWMTTPTGVNLPTIGLTSTWTVDDTIDLAPAGCVDSRVVTNTNPRVDVDKGTIGKFRFAAPPADHPVTGQLGLCLLESGQIIVVANVWEQSTSAAGELPDLVAAVVATLDVTAPDATPDACAPVPGEFRVQVIEEECA